MGGFWTYGYSFFYYWAGVVALLLYLDAWLKGDF